MQDYIKFNVLDVDSRRIAAKNCKLNSFIGNKEAVKRLSRAVFSALGNDGHNCSDYSFALFGPPSTGKTHLAKLFAKSVGIPFVVIEPQTIKRVEDIFVEMQKSIEHHYKSLNFNFNLYDFGNNTYEPPPCIVFIDEVHNLKSNIVQGLLKATEPNDRLMLTEEGGTVRTNNICWMIATTDRGDLFDAFDTRFQKVSLQLYSRKEIAQIVKLSNSDWSDELCELVALYNSQVPREALSFARDMRVEFEMNPRDWIDVASSVAKDHGIDRFGMTHTRFSILRTLGRQPMSATQLPFVAHVKEDELRKYIMPPLLCRTSDQPVPLVTVSSKGYTITPSGLRELDKRGIKHRGLEAMPESVRDVFEEELEREVCSV